MSATITTSSRITAPEERSALEQFVLDCCEHTGGVWEQIEPQVYDLLLEDAPQRVCFDSEALAEHDGAQLATLGAPVVDQLLDHARTRGAYTVLYADGLNAYPHDLASRLAAAFVPTGTRRLLPQSARRCFFPVANFRFVATFTSDEKEQAPLEVTIDLHSLREVRHLHRLRTSARLSGIPAEPLPEAPHHSASTALHAAAQQACRSLGTMINQRRREMGDRTERQIDRMHRYYTRMVEELLDQPLRGDPATAEPRRQSRIDAITRERALRVSELRRKSALRVQLSLSRVLIVHLPKILVRCTLSDRPGSVICPIFDLLTDAFEPLATPGTGGPTFDLAAIHVPSPTI